MLRNIAQRKRQFLDDLPPEPAAQVQQLQNYEFLDPEAQHKFQELIEQLRQAMANSLFNDMQKMVEEMSEGDLQRMKEMTRELNDMLTQRMHGEEPDFDGFMERYGDMFGDNPPQSLEGLIQQMQGQMSAVQSLMESLPPTQREQLQALLADKIGDPELEAELSELAQNLEFLNPTQQDASSYPFRGEEELTLDAAMRLMSEMQDIDDLERDLERAQYGDDLDSIDLDRLQELLGDEAVDAVEELKKLLDVLENAGYIRRDGDTWELTPRGTRMIGQKALAEIYDQLKRQNLGNHPIPEAGRVGERMDDSKPYEFGDPFHLDVRRTLMNAIEREGPQTPVRMHPDDFEVFRSRARHGDRHCADGRYFVVDGAARLIPGGEEGGAGAAEPDHDPTPARLAVHHRLLGVRARAEAAGAALRALGRVGAGHEHAPRPDAGGEDAGEASRRHAADHHDLGR